MDHPLDDSYLKLEQARNEINELEALIRERGRAVELRVEGMIAPNGDRITTLSGLPRWPRSWSVTAGAIAHNLRSALEYVVFQLSDEGEDAHTEFPISAQESAYRKPGRHGVTYRDRCLAGVDPKWASWVDKLQPFASPFPDQRDRELLILKSLSTRDKHHVGLPIASVIDSPFAVLTVWDSVPVENLVLRLSATGDLLDLSMVVKGARKRGNKMICGFEPKPQPEHVASVEVAFGDGHYTLPHLGLIHHFVEFVLDSTSRAFD
jgi:hypothetical protein